MELIERLGVKVLVLDNLSCLSFGAKECDNDDWDIILQWLMKLRRLNIAVIVAHHSGATKTRMRGGTRKEDGTFWVIKCERVHDNDREPGEKGIRFVSIFEKNRNSQTIERTREWHISTDDEGVISVKCETKTFDDMVLEIIKSGITSCTDIAEHLSSSKATVSRAAQRLMDQGSIDSCGKNGYKPALIS
jgi:hypothetical protein